MRVFLRAIVTMIPLLLLAPAALAQNRPYDRGYDQGYYGNGTYQDSCQNIHWDGSMLYAECQRADGGWRRTSIDSRNCRGQILNLDGRLACGEAGYQQGPYERPYDRDRGYYNQGPYNGGPVYQGNWEGGLPPGDYQLTCQNMHMEGDRLEARCEKRNGGWRRTSLDDVQRCTNAIVNDNGHLFCEKSDRY